MQTVSWSDQYSLAITYYQLRTGSMPFEKHVSFQELIQIHLQGRLDLSKLPEAERRHWPVDAAQAGGSLSRLQCDGCGHCRKRGLSTNFKFDMGVRPSSSGSFEILRPKAEIPNPHTAAPAATEQPTPTAVPPIVKPSPANVLTQFEIVLMDEPIPTRTFAKPVLKRRARPT